MKQLNNRVTGTGIVDGSITNADINASAAIDKTKISGTAITAADSGTVTSTMILDGTIVNADINASAAIAGTKVSPDFGAQNTTTTGNSTAAALIPSSSTVPTNGVYLPAANTLGFASNNTHRGRFNSDGDFLVGCTAMPSSTVFGTGISASLLSQANKSSVNTTNANVHWVFFNPNGAVGSISTSGSATAFNVSSDYRLKENIVPLTGAINRVSQLKVRRFNFIADPSATVDGFIAHEAQEIVPESVIGEKDAIDEDGNPIYQGIDQSKLVPLLTAALQEAIAKIETLEAKVAALEAA